MIGKIIAVIQITRPINFLISFFSIIVSCLICSGTNQKTIFIAALAGALTAAAGNVINDINDIDIDRINRPQRVLPSGRIDKKTALVLYIVLNIAAFVSGSMLNIPAFVIVIASIGVLFIYSLYLKKIPLLGNFIVAFMTALAFIFGGAAVDNWRGAVIPACFALFINLIREIIKDIEDIEGDRLNNVLTFPVRYGIKTTIKLIVLLTIILILLTLIPFILNYYKIEYFIIIMVFVNVILVFFLRSLLKDQSRENLRKLSSMLKINMAFGLLSIYLGKF